MPLPWRPAVIAAALLASAEASAGEPWRYGEHAVIGPSADDERRAPARFRISQSGSAAAIKQLMRACPAMARDLREACGI